jgi:hypothetical protein
VVEGLLQQVRLGYVPEPRRGPDGEFQWTHDDLDRASDVLLFERNKTQLAKALQFRCQTPAQRRIVVQMLKAACE